MTLNTFNDGEAVIAKELDSIVNAINQEYVENGVAPTKGAGSYDVDIASGTVNIAGTVVSVSGTTVSLTSAASDADLDSGEFRVDTITVDATGTVNVAEGTAAVKPIAPDIPSNEVLVALVVVDGSASSITSNDIRDARTIGAFTRFRQGFYGVETDGEVTRSVNGTENKWVRATNYTVESGVTMTVDNFTVIQATGKIQIDGTLDAEGAANNGGAGGSVSDDPGAGGGNGFTTEQAGGSGGTGATGNNDGGAGGDGDTSAGALNYTEFETPYQSLQGLHFADSAGAGGGGGGAGTNTNFDGNGGNGASPGGGGGGAASNGSGQTNGADGGDGGGLVMLVAPEIEITGSIIADGTDGGDAADNAGGGCGGGGGGGTGGLVYIHTPSYTNTGTITVDAGLGGSGGTDTGDGNSNGGDGADGQAGVIQVIQG